MHYESVMNESVMNVMNVLLSVMNAFFNLFSNDRNQIQVALTIDADFLFYLILDPTCTYYIFM